MRNDEEEANYLWPRLWRVTEQKGHWREQFGKKEQSD